MFLETMIRGLSNDEKLAAMDLIWRDLSANVRSFPSPTWHEQVVAQRLENPHPDPPLPLNKAKAETKEAIDARRASD